MSLVRLGPNGLTPGAYGTAANKKGPLGGPLERNSEILPLTILQIFKEVLEVD